jgi:two-component system, cell cycle sensor histidine kinase and response regulator CckA
MGTDVTDRERQREERQRDDRERDERYRELVELAPDGILIHDGERIVLANAAAVRLAGATRREQLVGLPIDTFLDPPYLKAVQSQLTDFAIPAELAPPVRDTFRRLDGSEVQVEVRAVVFMDRDRPSAHLIVRDITERLAVEQAARHLDRRLQQAQRMEAVGALAGGVAHEVNNMMLVVLGFSDFLLVDVRLPADCLADVREIMKAADRAAAVTGQLLAFSRRAVHRPQVVDLAAAVRAAEPVIRRLLGEGRRLVVMADAAPRVWIDPGQLEQVVINLALNARDAMPTGGTLTITTAESQLPSGIAAADGATIPAGRYATLLVHDTGAGMDDATKARIFEPFFTTKPMGQGTGLGLAAAHGILTQSSGYIAVASAPGQGAAFTMYLPVHVVTDTVERRGEPPRIGADATQAGATVLVVDDEPAVRAIAARSLEHGGFHVLQAPDGADALELVNRHGPPHLVLTDLMMPGIGGAELARRLRERWPELPILFMSGYSAEELRRQGAIGSEGELIQKPFMPDGLVASVAAALSRAALDRPARG